MLNFCETVGYSRIIVLNEIKFKIPVIVGDAFPSCKAKQVTNCIVLGSSVHSLSHQRSGWLLGPFFLTDGRILSWRRVAFADTQSCSWAISRLYPTLFWAIVPFSFLLGPQLPMSDKWCHSPCESLCVPACVCCISFFSPSFFSGFFSLFLFSLQLPPTSMLGFIGSPLRKLASESRMEFPFICPFSQECFIWKLQLQMVRGRFLTTAKRPVNGWCYLSHP